MADKTATSSSFPFVTSVSSQMRETLAEARFELRAISTTHTSAGAVPEDNFELAMRHRFQLYDAFVVDDGGAVLGVQTLKVRKIPNCSNIVNR